MWGSPMKAVCAAILLMLGGVGAASAACKLQEIGEFHVAMDGTGRLSMHR